MADRANVRNADTTSIGEHRDFGNLNGTWRFMGVREGDSHRKEPPNPRHFVKLAELVGISADV